MVVIVMTASSIWLDPVDSRVNSESGDTVTRSSEVEKRDCLHFSNLNLSRFRCDGDFFFRRLVVLDYDAVVTFSTASDPLASELT